MKKYLLRLKKHFNGLSYTWIAFTTGSIASFVMAVMKNKYYFIPLGVAIVAGIFLSFIYDDEI